MLAKNIECPSCGASVKWNASNCEFCSTELRFFAEEGAVLPTNLIAEDIESRIIQNEHDFWQATVNAINTPYSLFKKFPNYSAQNFKDAWWIKPYDELLSMFYNSFLILPTESLVTIAQLSPTSYAVLTSLRLVLIRGTALLPVALENFISWEEEKSLTGSTLIAADGSEYSGQAVLRYYVGESVKSVRFQAGVVWVSEEVIQSVVSCKEWEELDLMSRNLISLGRYKISRTYGIELAPLNLMSVTSKRKKTGCLGAATILLFLIYLFVN